MDDTQKQLVLDYQEIFGSAAGQRVYYDLSVRLNYSQSFAGIVQCGLPEHTALELGKREAFLYIMDKMKADPDKEQQSEYGGA